MGLAEHRYGYKRVPSNSVRVQWLSGQNTESRRGKISILMAHATRIITIAALFFCAGSAFAQTADKEGKEVAVIELGAATSWNFNGGWGFGPTVAVEVTPIEKWLELEAGVTPLFSRRSTEWGTDLLFKKPWTLSRKVELMAGIGPEWIHTNEARKTPNSVSGEAIIDVMFWPSKKHRFGWYVEPGYERNFGRGHEQSLGMSGGLLISIP
jgi:hypothetical protein